jgi:DNA repair protein RadC
LAAGRGIVEIGMREKIERAPIDSADPAFLRYLIATFAGLQEEHLLVLFLDRQQRFLAEERWRSVASNCIELRPSSLFRRALMLGSHALVLAHNHPSGIATPSADDVTCTTMIAADARRLDIQLIDHLVVGANDVVSMFRAGLLR